MFLLSFIFSGVYTYTRTGEQARVSAAVPMNLNFQARLMQGSGAIVADGTYSIEFNLYTAQNGGSSIWSETHPTVQIKNGYLSVYLGDIDNDLNTVDWSQQHWLTMNVNADGEMNPRLRLTSVPYAFRSTQADGITNGSSVLNANGIVQLAPSNIQAVNTALAALRINQQGTGLLAQFQGDDSDIFTIAKSGTLNSSGNATFSGGTLNLGSATQTGGLVINDGSANTASITTAPLGQNTVYRLPETGLASVDICVSAGNCGGLGDISQNGNALGTIITIGTNDTYGLNFETANITRLSIDTNGNANLTGALTAGTGLSVTAGGASITGNSTISGTLTGLTSLTSSGTVTLSGLGAGLVQSSTGGVLSSGTADRNSATFFTNALNVSNGGTGANTFTTNGIVFGNGTDALQVTSAGTGGQLLIANSSGVPSFMSMSGDGSLSDTGLLTIAGAAITNTKLENSTINLDFGTNLSGDATVALGGTLNIDFSLTPTFTSVTANTFTGSGAVTISSGGTGALTLDSASNTLVLADNTIQHSGSSLTVDVSNAGLSTFSIVNSNGTNVANLDVEGVIYAGSGLTVTSGGTVINGGIDNNSGGITEAGALSGITTISASGAITAATATNTINGLVINSGALTSVSGITFTSGNLTLGGGNISGVGTLALTGAISGATSINTINGLIINSGALSGVTTIGASGLATLSGGATISGASISINDASSFATNINTGSSSGTVTIGGGLAPLVINSTNFDVSNTGVVSGITGLIMASGALNLASEGITGGGLTDCDTGNSRLTWDNATSNFGCSTHTTRSFLDTTADPVVDSNTTNYWDQSAENGSVHPNITLTNSTNEIFGIVTMETTSTSNTDVEVSARIERTTNGANPTCGSSTTLGAAVGVFSTNNGGQMASTVSFVDSPATTNQVRYTLCSDTATVGTGANVTRIRFTLFELNNAADLAEVYPTMDTTLVPGEVVALDPSLPAGVMRSSESYQRDLYGVVSTDPAMVIGGSNGAGNNGVAVALSGRVPVKVSTQNGAIRKGDPLTSSSTPGVAMKAPKAGGIIGIAMDDYDGSGVGQVMLFVKSGYYTGSNLRDLLADQSKIGSKLASKEILDEFITKAQSADQLDTSDLFSDRIAASLELITPRVTAETISFNNLEAGAKQTGLNLQDDGSFVIYDSTGVVVAKFDDQGNAEFKGKVKADSVEHKDLQVSGGLSYLGGGASVVGGIDNNAGGISEAGAVMGVTSLEAQQLTVNATSTGNLLELKKDNNGVFTVFNNGALELRLDSANSFAVKDGSGLSIFNIDTINGIVKIGAGDNAKTVLFQLDAKVDSPQDPVGGTNGASYYNTKLERFRCYQDNRWTDCLPIGNLTDPIAMNRTIWSSMPSAESEYPGEPRILPDLTMAHEFKLRMRITTPGAVNATCRLQFAMNDEGPWADLMEGGTGELKIDQAGTLTTDWLNIKEDAQKEVVLRVMCKGGNGTASPVIYGVSVQLR